ncbi:hypothetical protein D6D18_05054 [Aureobasidium pullulans]|nr:hypothetical protein D6D18_05054 [Aureobasidium pullulans]
MVPTKAQKTVKSTETDDDGGITFKKKQDDLRKSVVIRQEKARTRIRKNRSNKQKDLQKRIEFLKRNITVEQDFPTIRLLPTALLLYDRIERELLKSQSLRDVGVGG